MSGFKVLHTQSIWLDPIPCAAPLPGPQNLSSVCYPSSPAQDSLRGWGSKFNPKWYFFFFFFPPFSSCSEAVGRQTAATVQQSDSGAGRGSSTGITGITPQ